MKIEIFVNTWGNYNENGADGGAWLTLPMEEKELDEKLEAIAKKMGDNDPEYFINDYSIEDIDMEIGELESIHALNELAAELDGLDDYDLKKYGAIMEAVEGDKYEALKIMGNYDFYEDITLEELAEQYVEEADIPENWKYYIDVAAVARDMSFDNYTETADGVLVA